MKIIVYINFILTLTLIGVVVWLFAYQKPRELITQTTPQYIDQCGESCKKQIEEIVTKNSKVETVKTVTITPFPVVTAKAKAQTAYIPIAGPLSSTSKDWYDLAGTEFYLNFNTDYGKSAYANWDASLKIKDGNGTVYARIYDVTNKIAVNGSEILVSNKGDLTQVISGGLSFWAGNNLYRVQLKSLNGFEVTFGSGRIKIIY
jgi:hypothetical protein